MKRTNKIDAAQALLHRAIALFLDEQDFLCALVLAGAAEDVFDGLLTAQQKPSARGETISLMLSLGQNNASDRFSEKDAKDLVRLAYNWPRHADRQSDAFEIHMDWRDAAGDVIDRAGANHYRITGQWPDRWTEVVSVLHFGG